MASSEDYYRGKKNLGFNLESISSGTEIITDEKTIHGMVTQFFEQWFAPPEGTNFGLMAEGASMNDFSTEDEFTAAYAHCNITREHIGRIYKAIVCPRDDWNSSENIKNGNSW